MYISRCLILSHFDDKSFTYKNIGGYNSRLALRIRDQKGEAAREGIMPFFLSVC